MAALRLSGQEAGALVLLEDHSRRSAWPDIYSFVPTDTRANTSSGRIVTDVGIGCPTLASYLSAAQVQAAIAEARSTAKYTKYLDLCSVLSLGLLLSCCLVLCLLMRSCPTHLSPLLLFVF